MPRNGDIRINAAGDVEMYVDGEWVKVEAEYRPASPEHPPIDDTAL